MARFAFVPSIIFITCAFALDPEQLKLIDDAINNIVIPTNHVTGMSLSVVHKGETVLSKGFGKMDIEKGIDATNDTLFAIASISKSIIAVIAVKTLSERFPIYGEAVMDIPIIELLPNLNFTLSDRFRTEQTSFRDLLSHRTCLIDNYVALTFSSVNTSAELSYRTRYELQNLNCGHRAGFAYSNTLYTLTGHLIASFHGVSVHEMVRDFMLEIGMENSTTIDEDGNYEDLPNMSQCYYRRDGRTSIFLGSGGILSTSTDMAKYMSFYLNKGRVGNKQIVSEEAMSWLTKPSISFGDLAGKQLDGDALTGIYGYGLGMIISLYKGYSAVGHSGNWPPFHSEMFLYPAKDLGVFMIVNGPGVLGDMSTGHAFVAALIFDIISGVKHPGLDRNMVQPLYFPLLDAKKKSAQENSYVAEMAYRDNGIEFEDVVGVYGEGSAGDMTITLDEEDSAYLQMNLGPWGIGRLVPVNSSSTKFLVDWKTDIVQEWYTFPPEVQPVPIFYIDFQLNALRFSAENYMSVVFRKNASLDTFPVIPWHPNSCGPN